MSLIPKQDSFRDQVCRALADNGPMTLSAVVSCFKNRNYGTVVTAVHQLKFHKTLALVSGVYSLTNQARVHYGLEPLEELNPAPIVISPRWARPLRKEYMLGHSLNADRFRTDASFINGSDGFIRKAA